MGPVLVEGRSVGIPCSRLSEDRIDFTSNVGRTPPRPRRTSGADHLPGDEPGLIRAQSRAGFQVHVGPGCLTTLDNSRSRHAERSVRRVHASTLSRPPSSEGASPMSAPTETPEFPSPKPSREGLILERNTKLIAETHRLAELRTRLLKLGGHDVLFYNPEYDLDALLERGHHLSAEGSETRRILGGSECHRTACVYWIDSKGATTVATGYALSDDGVWRQHSWGLELGTMRVIEPTVSRVLYFGFILTDDESERFAVLNWGEDGLAFLKNVAKNDKPQPRRRALARTRSLRPIGD
jgi:hypothetical protein